MRTDAEIYKATDTPSEKLDKIIKDLTLASLEKNGAIIKHREMVEHDFFSGDPAGREIISELKEYAFNRLASRACGQNYSFPNKNRDFLCSNISLAIQRVATSSGLSFSETSSMMASQDEAASRRVNPDIAETLLQGLVSAIDHLVEGLIRQRNIRQGRVREDDDKIPLR